jgi:tRNA C32,U32 (ribose-2'-O)-methylase TrmJ
MKNNFPCDILVEPQLAENIGMTARAMKNCAFSELRLVNPREDHLSDKEEIEERTNETGTGTFVYAMEDRLM